MGKPGYSCVVMFTPRNSLARFTSIQSGPVSTSICIERIIYKGTAKCAGLQCVILMVLCVAAAMAINAPASKRSGIICACPPRNCATPSMTISGEPAPFIFAPHAFKNSASATTSGSMAAFTIWLVPEIKAMVIMSASVVVCETNGKTNVAGFNLRAENLTSSSRSCTSAPSALNAFNKRSIGRRPNEHPPGYGNTALPRRNKSGPTNKTEARTLGVSVLCNSCV